MASYALGSTIDGPGPYSSRVGGAMRFGAVANMFSKYQEQVPNEGESGTSRVIVPVSTAETTRRWTSVRVFIAFTAIYVLWGSTYLAIRVAVATVPPLFAACV